MLRKFSHHRKKSPEFMLLLSGSWLFLFLIFSNHNHVGSVEVEENTAGGGVVVHKCLGRLHDAGEYDVVVPGVFVSSGEDVTFRLHRKELNCKKGRFKVLLQLLTNNSNELNGTSSSLIPDSTHFTPVVKILKTNPKTWETVSYTQDARNGDVKLMWVGNGGGGIAYLKIGNEYFHPDEYCFDQTDFGSLNELSLFVCNPECYGKRPCVKKCCGYDEVWDVQNKSCTKLQTNNNNNTTVSPWTPTLFSQSVDNCVKKLTTFHRSQVSVHLTTSFVPYCKDNFRVVPLKKIHDHAFSRFRVLWNGDVIVRGKDGNWSRVGGDGDYYDDGGSWCVDGMVNYGEEGTTGVYTGEFNDQVLLVCPDLMGNQVQKKPIPLRYAAMLLASAVILLITSLILSVLLWDHQNVYEWTVSCEVISMFFMILFVGIAHTVARKPEKSDFGSLHCIAIGVASHFCWLATFFWLFIINFEIWWNFRSLVQLRQSRKWFRFSVYLLVGWGCPLIIVLVGLLLDRKWGLQNEDLDCTNVIVPNYGQLNCYISKRAQGPYLFYPIGIILTFNLVFYLLTVWKMWGYQKKSQAIIQYRSRGQTQPTIIFLKLFIVMGVSWIFEIVSWAVTPKEVDRVPLYWVIFDIVTLFQAVSIFYIFVWKKQVLHKLWVKYPKARGLLSPLTKLHGCSYDANDHRVNSLATAAAGVVQNDRRGSSLAGGGGGVPCSFRYHHHALGSNNNVNNSNQIVVEEPREIDDTGQVG